MDNLHGIRVLRNAYYAMRHGRSLANEQGIIVSHPTHGIDGYGLTESGRKQVADSIRRATFLDTRTRIISSDFLRARETAELARHALRCGDMVLDVRLRERNFGTLELGPDDRYPSIWEMDEFDAEHTNEGVESAAAVMSRTTMLVKELENAFTEQVFVLVSHGDPMQILRAAFSRRPASAHRALPAIDTAEIGALALARP